MNGDDEVIAQALAEALGMSSNGSRLAGVFDGVPMTLLLQINRGTRQEGTTYNPSTKTFHPKLVPDPSHDRLEIQAELPFWPPLDVRPDLKAAAGLAALQSADRTSFAQRFLFRDDPRVAALFGPEAQEALEASFIADPGPKVGDFGIAWGASFGLPWPRVTSLVEPLRQVTRAWHAIWEAGRTLPAGEGCEDALAALAGLSLPSTVHLRGCPCGLAGTLSSVRVGMRVTPVQGGLRTWVGIRFPRPLAGGPMVMRESGFGLLDRFGAFLAGRAEIEIGDSSFDQHFAVRSGAPGALKNTLVDGVRRGMLDLDRYVSLRLDANGITGTSPPGDAESVAKIARCLLALGDQFGE